MPTPHLPVSTLLARCLRLRCPRCGRGPLFRGWIRMHPACDHCGLRFEREPGYFVGSIYINYGVTGILVMVALFGLFLGAGVSPDRLVVPLALFCLVFPLWFFRYARSLWMALDTYFDPHQGETLDATDSAAPTSHPRPGDEEVQPPVDEG